jgi:hypothetical protein
MTTRHHVRNRRASALPYRARAPTKSPQPCPTPQDESWPPRLTPDRLPGAGHADRHRDDVPVPPPERHRHRPQLDRTGKPRRGRFGPSRPRRRRPAPSGERSGRPSLGSGVSPIAGDRRTRAQDPSTPLPTSSREEHAAPQHRRSERERRAQVKLAKAATRCQSTASGHATAIRSTAPGRLTSHVSPNKRRRPSQVGPKVGGDISNDAFGGSRNDPGPSGHDDTPPRAHRPLSCSVDDPAVRLGGRRVVLRHSEPSS